MFDRTKGCTGYGCTTIDNNVIGYWTSNTCNSLQAWSIYNDGRLFVTAFNVVGQRGVRPVIQISKS